MCYSMKDAGAKHVREHTEKVGTKKKRITSTQVHRNKHTQINQACKEFNNNDAENTWLVSGKPIRIRFNIAKEGGRHPKNIGKEIPIESISISGSQPNLSRQRAHVL